MSRIVCDMDGVLADFTGALVDWLNKTGRAVKRGGHYSVNEFRDYALTTVVPKEHLKEAAHDPNFVHGIPRYEGAQQFLKDLLSAGHEVQLVTAPWTGPYHTQAREDFVDSLLSFRGGHRVKFEWATPEERLMMPGDFLVEDRYETAEAWGKQGRPCLLIDQPWNRDYRIEVENVHRCLDYRDAVDLIKLLGSL